MAIDPKLLVLKPVSELETVNNPTTGSLLFYNGGDELKKTGVADFYNAMQSAYLGIATTTTTPPVEGAYWYRVDAPGTYMGVTVTEADFKDAEDNYFDVTIEVKDGVAEKKIREIPAPTFDAENITPGQTTFAQEVTFYGKNILDPKKKINNKGIISDGSIYDEPAYYIFDKVAIQGGKTYSSTHVSYANFYDAGGNFLEFEILSGIFTTPGNAAFATFMVSNSFPEPQVELGATQTAYEAYIEEYRTAISLDTIRKHNDDIVEIGDRLTKEVRMPSLITTSDHEIYRNDRPKQNLYLGGSGLEIYDNSNPFFYGNVAGGHRALANCDASMTNVALGNFVLENFGKEVNPGEPVGADCTGVGDQVMRNLIAGVGNSGFGKLSLARGTLYANCSAYGDTSLEFNNANSNNAFGYSAGIRLKYGNNNCLFGTFAGGTAIPDRTYYSSEQYMASFNECTVFGNGTMQFNKEGSRNAIFGHMAGHIFEGEDNCFFGAYSFRNIGVANRNTGVGNYTGLKVTTGSNNSFFGFNSGNVVEQKVDVTNSIAIGYNTYSTKNNQIVLGNSTNDEFVICGVTFTKAQLEALKNLV